MATWKYTRGTMTCPQFYLSSDGYRVQFNDPTSAYPKGYWEAWSPDGSLILFATTAQKCMAECFAKVAA